jgi:phage tail-like protein
MDPNVSMFFGLEIDGIQSSWKSVSGLESSMEVVLHKESTKEGKLVVRKAPGQKNFNDFTFTRGVTTNMDLTKWHKQVLDGKINDARKNIGLTLYAQGGKAIATWAFSRAWPTKLTLSGLSAGANEVAIESMTIAADFYHRTK